MRVVLLGTATGPSHACMGGEPGILPLTLRATCYPAQPQAKSVGSGSIVSGHVPYPQFGLSPKLLIAFAGPNGCPNRVIVASSGSRTLAAAIVRLRFWRAMRPLLTRSAPYHRTTNCLLLSCSRLPIRHRCHHRGHTAKIRRSEITVRPKESHVLPLNNREQPRFY